MDILMSADQGIVSAVARALSESESVTNYESFAKLIKYPVSQFHNCGTEIVHSRFNYLVQKADQWLVYNTLYNSLTRLNKEEYLSFSSLEFNSDVFLNAFREQGLVINKDLDELHSYNLLSRMAAQYLPSKLSITVTPTMECNANCFYCYEHGFRQGRMTNEKTMKLVEAIKNLDTTNGIRITWFGGEPLLNQEWMDFFAGLLKAENIEFSAFLITNGSMLDEKAIKKMKHFWNIDSVQISFDGGWEEYIRRKHYHDQDENVYFRILKQIKKLSKAGIYVHIRLNIDRGNVESILEIVEDIGQLYGRDEMIKFYPAFLTGSKEPFTEDEKVKVIKRIIAADEHNKISINQYLYKIPKNTACYYYQENAYSIDTDGDLYRCERMLGKKEKAMGNIDSGFPASFDKSGDSGKREECEKCVFWPKCYGGCQEAYDNGDDPCFIEKYLIRAYLEMI